MRKLGGERAGRRPFVVEHHSSHKPRGAVMSIGTGPVVVGLDLQPGDHRTLLEFAAAEANRRRASVRLVHGCAADWSVGAFARVLTLSEREDHARQQLDLVADQLRPLLDPGLEIEISAAAGSGTAVLLEEAPGAALLVLQRRDISRIGHVSTGSATSSVSARADCSVAVVREGAPTEPRSGVVVGVDDAGHAQHAVEMAFEEASLRQTSLTAVHVWSSQDALMGYGWVAVNPESLAEQRERVGVGLSEALAGFRTAFPDVAVSQRLVDATVAEGLLNEARDAELLVVGRHGRGRVGSLALGSVARRCIDSASCPVLVAPYSRPPRRDSWLMSDVAVGPSF
jgi:nucleotide-binding universal stress UspA family protein